MENLIKELEKAKENVLRLLEHSDGLIDMHWLEYRAWKVEKLRNEIKENL